MGTENFHEGPTPSRLLEMLRQEPATEKLEGRETVAALAYAEGYTDGLDAAKDKEVGALIKERDAAQARYIFEKALRQVAERERDELRARYAAEPTKPQQWRAP